MSARGTIGRSRRKGQAQVEERLLRSGRINRQLNPAYAGKPPLSPPSAAGTVKTLEGPAPCPAPLRAVAAACCRFATAAFCRCTPDFLLYFLFFFFFAAARAGKYRRRDSSTTKKRKLKNCGVRCAHGEGGGAPLVRFWDNSVLLGFRSKPSTQLVCDAHQAGDLVRVTTKWTTCVLHRYRLTTSHRLVPSQQQVDSL